MCAEQPNPVTPTQIFSWVLISDPIRAVDVLHFAYILIRLRCCFSVFALSEFSCWQSTVTHCTDKYEHTSYVTFFSSQNLLKYLYKISIFQKPINCAFPSSAFMHPAPPQSVSPAFTTF